METDGSPPHCIIYKYGFLHVSITSMCVCMFVCVFVHMPTLFPLPLCIWDQVCPLSMIWCVFADAYVCLQALFHCLPLFVCCVSAWAYTHFHCVLECVYVCVCVCVCACGIHTLHIFQVEFFFRSPVCGWKCYSLLIKLLFLSAHLIDLSGMFSC